MLREEERGKLLHRGIVRISLPLILELINLSEEYIQHEVYIDPVRGLLCIVLEHPSLPLVEEGCPIPRLEPLYRRLERRDEHPRKAEEEA